MKYDIFTSFKEQVYHQHDIVCNQKYGSNLPYSFHLKAAEAQGRRFISLIHPSQEAVVFNSIAAHDLIEDARMSYSDVEKLAGRFSGELTAKNVANIVYAVTDEKGRNRAERKSYRYYEGLRLIDHAVFVKLSDIAANTLYSKLMNSSMYPKYKEEWPKVKGELYTDEYKEFFEYIDSL